MRNFVLTFVACMAFAFSAAATPNRYIDASDGIVVACGTGGIATYDQEGNELVRQPGSWGDCVVNGTVIQGLFKQPKSPSYVTYLKTFPNGLNGGSSTTPPYDEKCGGFLASGGGKVYWANCGKFSEIHKDGSKGLAIDTGTNIGAIATNGTLVFVLKAGELTAWNPSNADIVWSKQVSHSAYRVSVGDGVVSVVGRGVTAFRVSNGEMLFRSPIVGRSVKVVGDKTLVGDVFYVTNSSGAVIDIQGQIRVLGPDGGEITSGFVSDAPQSLAYDGAVLAATNDGVGVWQWADATGATPVPTTAPTQVPTATAVDPFNQFLASVEMSTQERQLMELIHSLRPLGSVQEYIVLLNLFR